MGSGAYNSKGDVTRAKLSEVMLHLSNCMKPILCIFVITVTTNFLIISAIISSTTVFWVSVYCLCF